MPFDDHLAGGFKREINLALYESELAIIDTLRARYNCSRAAIIGAWAREHKDMDMSEMVKAGRRPGGGRKKKGAAR